MNVLDVLVGSCLAKLAAGTGILQSRRVNVAAMQPYMLTVDSLQACALNNDDVVKCKNTFLSVTYVGARMKNLQCPRRISFTTCRVIQDNYICIIFTIFSCN
jgi:hypothetical protein